MYVSGKHIPKESASKVKYIIILSKWNENNSTISSLFKWKTASNTFYIKKQNQTKISNLKENSNQIVSYQIANSKSPKRKFTKTSNMFLTTFILLRYVQFLDGNNSLLWQQIRKSWRDWWYTQSSHYCSWYA